MLTSLIEDRSFATLVSNGPDGPIISHLPMVLDKTAGPLGTLIGHVARANMHWKVADLTVPSVVIFSGPDAYVSPNWYPSKAETGKAVPTWNYRVVHVTGLLRIHDDRDWTRAAVTRLTDRHEGPRPNGWTVDDAPAAFIEAQLRGIVGISIEISTLEGKDKISQNRSETDRQGVIRGLEADATPASDAMAELMRSRGSD